MTEPDHEAIVTIAYLAAQADGRTTPDEQVRLRAVADQFGITGFDAATQRAARGGSSLSELSHRLSGDDARRLAYEAAVAVCHADGPPNELETRFLDQLRGALALDPEALTQIEQEAAALAGAPLRAAAVEIGTGQPPTDAELDDLILNQAMITGAVELLPDKLATLAILPLQLRLVYRIGRRYGQPLDGDQVKDLVATLGLGAASQLMEQVVRRVVGGVTGSLLGGLLGGASGLAAGVAVTFTSTYALGHVAKQYYAQGRRISASDLRTLFGRFQEDAKTLFPKVQQQIQAQAKSLNLKHLVSELG
jgi:uncharacterized protein (DUF697 family)/tellurite resistance protein